MQAEQSKCLQGTRTAIRSPAQPQTEQAACGDLAEGTLNISENEFCRCCGTDSAIVDNPEPLKGSCRTNV